jgi:hypothetical protein
MRRSSPERSLTNPKDEAFGNRGRSKNSQDEIKIYSVFIYTSWVRGADGFQMFEGVGGLFE